MYEGTGVALQEPVDIGEEDTAAEILAACRDSSVDWGEDKSLGDWLGHLDGCDRIHKVCLIPSLALGAVRSHHACFWAVAITDRVPESRYLSSRPSRRRIARWCSDDPDGLANYASSDDGDRGDRKSGWGATPVATVLQWLRATRLLKDCEKNSQWGDSAIH